MATSTKNAIIHVGIGSFLGWLFGDVTFMHSYILGVLLFRNEETQL